MMKYMTRFETSIPIVTSIVAIRSSNRDAPRRFDRLLRPADLSSSTSWLVCQKKRYGEIVVPRIATSVAMYWWSAEIVEWGPDEDRVDDVREERDREVLEDPLDEAVSGEDLHREKGQGDRDHEPGDRRPDDDARGVGDRAEIGADVDDIGDEHESDGRI